MTVLANVVRKCIGPRPNLPDIATPPRRVGRKNWIRGHARRWEHVTQDVWAICRLATMLCLGSSRRLRSGQLIGSAGTLRERRDQLTPREDQPLRRGHLGERFGPPHGAVRDRGSSSRSRYGRGRLGVDSGQLSDPGSQALPTADVQRRCCPAGGQFRVRIAIIADNSGSLPPYYDIQERESGRPPTSHPGAYYADCPWFDRQ